MRRFVYLMGLVLLALACRKEASPLEHGALHEAKAPHGGTAIPLGEDHQMEWVQDTNEGRLDVYFLDDDMENFIRISAAKVDLIVAGETLVLHPMANSATGETVGDTSQFEANAGWLKTNMTWQGVVPHVDIHGETFTNVPLRLGEGTSPKP